LKKLFRFTHRAALGFILSCLVALALSLSVLRLWLLPEAPAFRQTLETRIGALIGETVRIDSLAARLHGFHPEISADGFHILDTAGRSAIRFATVRLILDPFRTLATGEPRFSRVEIVGPKLSIRRKEDGSIAVVGLTILDTPPAWLLADGRIDLLDAEVDWQDQRTQAPPLPLGRVDLRLRNQSGRHRLRADFALPENLGRSLRLVLDARGDLFQTSGWQGAVYLEGHGIDAGRLASGLPPSSFGLRAGMADARIWVQWQGALRSVAGEFGLKAPVFAYRPEPQTEHRLALAGIGSRFLWESHDNGWRLDLGRFQPALHEPWPRSRLAVAVDRRADGTLSAVSAAASHINLGDIGTILHALPVLDGETGAVLRALAPRGTLENLRFFHAPAAPLGERLALCGRFRDLAANGWRSMPGFSGLNGHACGTDGFGRAILSAAPGSLDLVAPGLKRRVPLADLQATLSWRQTETDWILAAPALSARNSELALQSRIRAVFPKQPDASPFVDLQTRLTGVDVAAIRHYLPAAFMPDTAKWAERSLSGGRISRGDILFQGHTADFPFPRNEGVFEAEIDAENAAVKFHPDWPPLAQTDAHIAFHGSSVDIDVKRGLIGAGHIAEARAVIEDMGRTPRLALAGEVRAGVSDVLDFLDHSPLRAISGRLNQFARVSGGADIALNLTVPLNAGPGETAVDGTATFHGAALRIKSPDLSVENLEGPLHFRHTGLRAEGIRARILGQPAVIGVNQEDGEVRIEARGKAGVAALQKPFPSDFWRYARGTADYRLELRFPETPDARSVPARLALDSDLAGIALDLPAPFGKPESEIRPSSVEASFQTDGRITARLAYGPDIRAQLRFSGPEHGFRLEGPSGRSPDGRLRLEGGDIAIGQPLPAASEAHGISLSVRMDELDAGEWRRWWAGNGTDEGAAGLLRELHAQIGKVVWQGESHGSLALDLTRDSGLWRGRIDSAYAKGGISASPDSIHLDLDSLKFPKGVKSLAGAAETAPPAADGNKSEIDPADVPSLKLRARRLLWKNADLGPLELDTERRAHGMIIKTLTVAARDHKLELHGNWTRTPNRAASTHLEGKAHVDSLGDFLVRLGRRGEIRETPSDLDFVLDWPGAPYRFSAGTVAGEIKLNLGEGSLLSIEPGLGRVIGMLNLNSLWRRLSFDFSDLFGKGMAYDGIAGTFRIGGGQAITEGFLIDAVSARIVVSGRAGLVARDLDQRVAVIPHTTAALPIAGALAGGPAVGAAVYVAQRLIGEEVDSITATHYAIKGSWDNPAITRVHHNMPLDMLDQAWSGVKNLSGFGSKQEEQER
jgi:uncharacterized protein (TIGR02099 family)